METKLLTLLQIVEYSIPRRKYTEFSKSLQGRLPNQWLARSFPITNIAFDQNNENIIIMHDDTTVFVINKSSDLPCSTAKIAKLENGYCKEESSTSSSTSSHHAIQVVKKYKVCDSKIAILLSHNRNEIFLSISFYSNSIWYIWHG